MMSAQRYTLRRGFWVSLAILILWKCIPPSIYFFSRGVVNLPALFMAILGLLIVFALIDGRGLRMLDGKELGLLEVIAGMTLISAILLLDLDDAVSLEPVASTGYRFFRVQAFGAIGLFFVTIWQLVVSIFATRKTTPPKE